MPGASALAAFLALAAPGCAQPSWQQVPTTNEPRKHVMIQFTDTSLHPSIARVLRGGTVSWVNYASMFSGSVVFPASLRDSLMCDNLRPNFMEVAAGYQSIPITRGVDDIGLPCPLKPGQYEYQLYLFSGHGLGGGAEMLDPEVTMAGKIIAE